MEAIALITVIALPAVIFLCEAWLEEVIIDLKNPYISDYSTLNHQEHLRSAVFAILITGSFMLNAWYLHHYWLFAYLFVCRRMFFDPALKLVRGRKIYRYEGNGPIDRICKTVFGVNGAVKEWILEILIAAVSIYLTLKS